VDAFVFALIAGAAVLHAAWNILLKTAGDPLRAATIGMVAGGLVLVPAAAIGWMLAGQPTIPAEAWALGVGSGFLEAAYFAFLSAAYRRGELSVVYPIARGTGVFLAVAAGIVVLGERPGPLAWLGIAVLLGGLLALQRPWRVLRAGTAGFDPAVGFALLTGLTIAGYSTLDRTGTRLVEPWLYAAILWATTATILVGWQLARRRATRDAPDLGRVIAGGLLTLGAYLLVLVAFRLAPLSAVAPLRESAIVLASGWGAIRLQEASGRHAVATRLGAAAVVALGAGLLALDG
jgi:drug/metabolite transporter (DMT)-like permease